MVSGFQAKLYQYLLQCMHNAVLSLCKTNNEAAQFYDSTVNKVPPASLPFQRIFNDIFSVCLRRCNPAGLMDFEPKHTTVINIMFSGSAVEFHGGRGYPHVFCCCMPGACEEPG